MEVVGEHYSAAFTSTSGHWLHFFSASDCAVYLFFLMSGFVLTPSFEKTPHDLSLNMKKRIVRLGLPAAAAMLLSLIFFVAAPDLAPRSAEVSHSAAMLEQTRNPEQTTAGNYLADALGLTLLTGYQETSLFMPFVDALPRMQSALNPPIWTLHVELWGSALVLALVWAGTRSKIFYALTILGAAAFIGTNSLILFLVGHLCARLSRMNFCIDYGKKVPTQVLAMLLVIGGLALCFGGSFRGLWLLLALLDHGVLHSLKMVSWPAELGAIMLFIGVLYSPLLHPLLNSPPLRWLGRLSFPVYLVHWPVMMVVGSAAFLWAAEPFGLDMAASVALLVGLLVTLVVAELFERWCDQPVVTFGRNLGKNTAVPAT